MQGDLGEKNQSKIQNLKSKISLTGVVLAGGRSSRMGQDKALLDIQGRPMLQRVCDVAISLCDRVYVVTPWPERYQHLLSPPCQLIREVLPFEEENNGDNGDKKIITNSPIVGFAQGLTCVSTDWVLLLACDLPQLQVEVLQGWAAQLNEVAAEAIALLPQHTKGWEPLCGFYRRSCLTALTLYIKQGGRSLQQWLAQHPIQALPLLDRRILFNCNTPTDYAALQKVN